MGDALADPDHRYVLDGSDVDLQRLVKIAEVSAGAARTQLQRTGVGPGASVVDCGCGPLGALAVLADLVGPTGRVVGIEMNEVTAARARSVTEALGFRNVEVLVGDVHEMDAAQVGAPFDLAFSRCFLMHQSDPAKTLAKVAGLLRPGGWVVVQEPLRDPVPRAYPPCHSLNAYFELMYAVVEHFGAEPEAVNRLQAAAARAGLDLVEADGHFTVHPPEVGFELHAGTAAAVKDRAVHAGLITNEDMDALIGKLNRAREHGYEWVTSPFFLHLTLRKR